MWRVQRRVRRADCGGARPTESWPAERRVQAINRHIDEAFRGLLPQRLQTDELTPGL
ncbi:MAG: hypothetical protein ACI8TX_003080 [Hyphomicrobiaceae bacterium]|jgi:hypothetical protein